MHAMERLRIKTARRLILAFWLLAKRSDNAQVDPCCRLPPRWQQ